MDKKILEPTGEGLAFYCPGCKQAHVVYTSGKTVWQWNGSMTSPTFTPSLLCTWHDIDSVEKKRCHTFITDGKIQFLGDCTHDLKGQTVDIPEFKWYEDSNA